jgi:spore germination protein (amino acid permease)
MKHSITSFQAFWIFILSVGVTNHVLLIPVLFQTAKRDAWLGGLWSLLPSLIWVSILYIILKKANGKHLLSELQASYGRWITIPLKGALIAYCLILIFVTLKDTCNWTVVSYLPYTPRSAIAAVIMLFCAYAAKLGLRTIAVCSGVLLPGVAALGFFVMSANFQYKDYSLLFPILTHGYMPAFRAMAYTLAGVSELFLFLFIQHHCSTPIKWSGLATVSVILIGLALGPLMGSIAIFGPFESTALRYPPFELWRMVTLGKFISHLDFFSIFQWLSGSFIRISFLLYILIESTGAKSKRARSILSALVAILLFIAVVRIHMDEVRFTWFTREIFYPGMIVAGFGLMVIIAVLLFGSRVRRGRLRESN